jgi:DNA-binding transcriptional regulator GbsR (MarR family)
VAVGYTSGSYYKRFSAPRSHYEQIQQQKQKRWGDVVERNHENAMAAMSNALVNSAAVTESLNEIVALKAALRVQQELSAHIDKTKKLASLPSADPPKPVSYVNQELLDRIAKRRKD